MSEESAKTPSEPRPVSKRGRWLLIASLALNLFFIGLAAAVLLKETDGFKRSRDRSMSARIERIASVLPEADAEKLRGQFQANKIAVETARRNYDASRESIREILRREPFDAEAMRAVLAERRAARQNYDQVLYGVLVTAVEQMSPQGRRDLADWRSKWRQLRQR